MPYRFSRRGFLGAAAGAVGASMAWPRRAAAVPGNSPIYAWGTESEDYVDQSTGARVRVMTPGESEGQVIYQTDPMWANDMRYLVYQYGLPGKTRLPHARQMASGIVRPMLEEPATIALSRTSDRLYLIKDGMLMHVDVIPTFQTLRAPKRIAKLPAGISPSGGLSVDATGEKIALGVKFDDEADTWGVMYYEFKTLKWTTRARANFHVSHVQAHPSIGDFVMFCHETGGDAPQRMWAIQPGQDAAMKFHEERYEEWITHETWWANNRALFTISPYDEEHKQKPHGIASINIKGEDFMIHNQYDAWHTHGSPDGKWILGDDFDRNLWLIHPPTGERRLLTGGHLDGEMRPHPHASFTPDSRAVVFNSGKFGKEDVMIVELPPWDNLPAMKQGGEK